MKELNKNFLTLTLSELKNDQKIFKQSGKKSSSL